MLLKTVTVGLCISLAIASAGSRKKSNEVERELAREGGRTFSSLLNAKYSEPQSLLEYITALDPISAGSYYKKAMNFLVTIPNGCDALQGHADADLIAANYGNLIDKSKAEFWSLHKRCPFLLHKILSNVDLSTLKVSELAIPKLICSKDLINIIFLMQFDPDCIKLSSDVGS